MAYTLTQWNLGELYPGFDSPDLQMAFDNVEEQVMSFEGIRGKLLPDIASNQFMEFVRASEQTSRPTRRTRSRRPIWRASSSLRRRCRTAPYSSACGGRISMTAMLSA